MFSEWLSKTLGEIDAAKSVAALFGLLVKKQSELLKFFNDEFCGFKNSSFPNYSICEVDAGLEALLTLREHAQEKAKQLTPASHGMQQQFDTKCQELEALRANIQGLLNRTSDFTIFKGQKFGSDCLDLGRIIGRELDPAGSGKILWQKLWHRGTKNPVIREMLALVPLSEESLQDIMKLNALPIGGREFVDLNYQQLVETIKEKIIAPEFRRHFNGLTAAVLRIACSVNDALTVAELRYKGALQILTRVEQAFKKLREKLSAIDLGDQGIEVFRPGICRILEEPVNFDEIKLLYSSLDKAGSVLGNNTAAVKQSLRVRYEKIIAAMPDLMKSVKLALGVIDRLKEGSLSATDILKIIPQVAEDKLAEEVAVSSRTKEAAGSAVGPAESVVMISLPPSVPNPKQEIAGPPPSAAMPEAVPMVVAILEERPVASVIPQTTEVVAAAESDTPEPRKESRRFSTVAEKLAKVASAGDKNTERSPAGEDERCRRVRRSVADNPALTAMAKMFRGGVEGNADIASAVGDSTAVAVPVVVQSNVATLAQSYISRLQELMSYASLSADDLSYVREAYFFFYDQDGNQAHPTAGDELYNQFDGFYRQIQQSFDLATGAKVVVGQVASDVPKEEKIAGKAGLSPAAAAPPEAVVSVLIAPHSVFLSSPPAAREIPSPPKPNC